MESQPKKKKIEPWPLALLGALACFMAGIVFAVTVMVRQDVPLVAEDYYAQELAFQDRIDRETLLAERGGAPELQLAGRSGARLNFPRKGVVNPGEGKITFFRPSNSEMDFQVPVNPDAEGLQEIGLDGVAPGLWMVQVEWEEGKDRFYYETELLLKP